MRSDIGRVELHQLGGKMPLPRKLRKLLVCFAWPPSVDEPFGVLKTTTAAPERRNRHGCRQGSQKKIDEIASHPGSDRAGRQPEGVWLGRARRQPALADDLDTPSVTSISK